MRLWPKGRWKNLKMGAGEGSTDRHGPFILTLGRHEMLDCAYVQRVQQGLAVGGRRESLLHPQAPWEQDPHTLCGCLARL